MSPRPADSSRPLTPADALARSLRRVSKNRAEALDSLDAAPVHDLRVALRRCRSLAEGFATLDKHRDWRRMRKVARNLQDGLGKLRDAQVMARGVHRLQLTEGPAGAAVANSLRRDERKGRKAALRALEDFPRKRWKTWRRRLPKRARRVTTGPACFATLCLQRAAEAAARERRWRGSQSHLAAHSLRIAVKHFRYTLEGFLPEEYAAWERDLKRMQDCLGEIHDLDVLRGWTLQVVKKESLPKESVHAWMERIASAREQRVQRYKKLVSAGGGGAAGSKRAEGQWDRWRREIGRVAAVNPPNRAGVWE
jgi:CHAD domain-containing protein